MVRLYDRFRAGTYQLLPLDSHLVTPAEWAAIDQSVRAEIAGAELIVADNIDEFFNSFWPAHEVQPLNQLDIPNIIPPFPKFFVEWKNASPYFRSKGFRDSACLCHAEKDGDGWLMRWRIFMTATHTSALITSTYQWAAWIPEDGSKITRMAKVPWNGKAQFATADAPLTLDHCCAPFLLAVSFMNCRNVTMPWVQPPDKLAKSFMRRHKVKLAPYRTIDIIPMTRLISTASAAAAQGSKQSVAFQTVRGHFKRYADAGLFGKHKGTFFFTGHNRGGDDRQSRPGGYRIKLGGKQR